MMSTCFYFQLALNRLFNNCIKLYQYWISSSWIWKGRVRGGEGGQIKLSHPKIFSKRPALLVLKLITLYICLKYNSWFNTCFKFLSWVKYLVLSCKLVTSFSIFSIFILSGKNGNHYQIHVIFWSANLKRTFFITFFITASYEIFIKWRSIFNPLKMTYWKLLRYCPTI